MARWIAVDWGTTSLRVWHMEDAVVLDQRTSEDGMGTLAPDEFEPTLLALVELWIVQEPCQVVICGMAGAKQGWIEAPYAAVPSQVTGIGVMPNVQDPRLSVTVLGGMSQANPADVMRGEETQIAGFLEQDPTFDGVICLPGTHTKWARISAREVVSFATYMSGELYGLLSRYSVLKHSMSSDWDDSAFEDALGDAISNPARFAARLFSIRAASLLQDQSGGVANAKLSGALIGIELAASRAYWLGQSIAIIGADALALRYQSALFAQGASAQLYDVEKMTLAGLYAAYQKLEPSL